MQIVSFKKTLPQIIVKQDLQALCQLPRGLQKKLYVDNQWDYVDASFNKCPNVSS